MDEKMSTEDREAREKGLELVARLEQLAMTNEGFRRWLLIGFVQVATGQVVAVDQNGCEEE